MKFSKCCPFSVRNFKGTSLNILPSPKSRKLELIPPSADVCEVDKFDNVRKENIRSLPFRDGCVNNVFRNDSNSCNNK